MLDEKTKDKIREKFRQQGIDYDVCCLAAVLEHTHTLSQVKK